jgi:hypothetical protein
MSRQAIINRHASWVARPFGYEEGGNYPEVMFSREELLRALGDEETTPLPYDWYEVIVPRLNVRESASTTARVVRVLTSGQVVAILRDEQVRDGNYVWGVMVEGETRVGRVALNFMRRRSAGVATRPKSLIGLHFAGGNLQNSVLEMMARLHQISRPVALVTVVANAAYCERIKSVSPDTVVVYRPYLFSDDQNPFTLNPERRMTGEEWLRLFDLRNARADYYSFANEWYPDAVRYGIEQYAQFYIELMEACARAGIKCTFGDFAVGHVEPEHRAKLAPMFLRGYELFMPLRYHAYSSPHADTDMRADAQYFALRWTQWFPVIPYKVVIGEAGKYQAPRFVNPQLTVSMMAQLDELLQPHRSRVLGAAWWTLSATPDWALDDFTPALPQVERYLRGV